MKIRLLILLIAICSSHIAPALSNTQNLLPTVSPSGLVKFNSSSINSPAINSNTSQPANLGPASNLENINNIDNNANDLMQLKRKLEVEKTKAELKRLHTGENTSSTNGTKVNMDNAQTTVTGVAINQDGKKMAWLQFADGGSLLVNLGSRVGKYTVTDISMSGVTLSYTSGKKHTHNIFLKRVYYATEKPKNQLRNNPGPFFTPSPVLTNANTLANPMVPPIVPIRKE